MLAPMVAQTGPFPQAFEAADSMCLTRHTLKQNYLAERKALIRPQMTPPVGI
jgi:hypothetical protein